MTTGSIEEVKRLWLVTSEFDVRIMENRGSFKYLVSPERCGSKVGASTARDYVRISDRFIEKASLYDDRVRGLIEVITLTKSSGTFFVRVAALESRIRAEACVVWEYMERISSQSNFYVSDACYRVQLLLDLTAALQAVSAKWAKDPDEVRQQLASRKLKRRLKSAKDSLRKLPDTWCEDLCHAGGAGRYRVALAVCALSGCRPRELELGVALSVEKVEGGFDVLAIRIQGAKVRDGCGQPFRVLRYLHDGLSELVSSLVQQVRSTTGEQMLVKVAKGENFSIEVARLGRSLWPRHPRLSAGCFRHQFAAEAKRQKTGGKASEMLGHRSLRTKRFYAKASQARGRVLPFSVEVEFPIADSEHTSKFGHEHVKQSSEEEPE